MGSCEFYRVNEEDFSWCHRVSLGFTRFPRISLDFIGFYWVYQVLARLTWLERFYWVQLIFIAFSFCILGGTWLLWILIGFRIWFCLNLECYSCVFTSVLCCVSGILRAFSWISLDAVRYFWVSRSFTEFYRVFPATVALKGGRVRFDTKHQRGISLLSAFFFLFLLIRRRPISPFLFYFLERYFLATRTSVHSATLSHPTKKNIQ